MCFASAGASKHSEARPNKKHVAHTHSQTSLYSPYTPISTWALCSLIDSSSSDPYRVQYCTCTGVHVLYSTDYCTLSSTRRRRGRKNMDEYLWISPPRGARAARIRPPSSLRLGPRGRGSNRAHRSSPKPYRRGPRARSDPPRARAGAGVPPPPPW